MSDISRRLMRGEHISEKECDSHAEEIAKTLDAYAPAMAAMEAYEAKMAACTCEWDGDVREDGSTYAIRHASLDCPVDHGEDE